MRDFKILACVDQDGVVRRKFLLTAIELSGLGCEAAEAAGFVLSDDGSHWHREVTPGVIEHETRHEPHFVKKTLAGPEHFPVDTMFKEAWVFDSAGAVVHDMSKARDIHRSRLRTDRAPLLEALDLAYMRADERGDPVAKSQIAKRKQMLRDAPNHPAIDAAASVDDLKAIGLPAEDGN